MGRDRAMTEVEAIERANQFIFERERVKTEPVEVHLVRRADSDAYWWISYGTAVYYPTETAAGDVIDGGDYIVKVDVMTGEVSLLK